MGIKLLHVVNLYYLGNIYVSCGVVTTYLYIVCGGERIVYLFTRLFIYARIAAYIIF